MIEYSHLGSDGPVRCISDTDPEREATFDAGPDQAAQIQKFFAADQAEDNSDV